MHSNGFGSWFCGPASFFSGPHFGGFFALLFWVLVFILLFSLLRSLFSLNKIPKSPGGQSSAVSILEQKYASGEIDRDEYLQKKSDLS